MIQKRPSVAIDAMGGDLAPDAVLRGVLRYVAPRGDDSIKICLFGPKKELCDRLYQLNQSWEKYKISIIDATERIEMGEDPVRAVRAKRKSSLVKAVKSVAEGECDAVMSAGNSGAVMAASLFLIGREDGVERPALVGLVPAYKRPVVCLDLGANADCKVEHLYQFAHMGVRYASSILKIENPSVALLSNGEEDGKGSLLTKEVFALLQQSSLRFVGNVEPLHVLQNKADVVVCDGFSGNVFLKTLEVVANWCCKIVGQHDEKYAKLLQKKLCLDRQAGASLLGIKKPAIVLHGNSFVDVVERAIDFAHKTVLCGFNPIYGDEKMIINNGLQSSISGEQ